jgi:hypothetical protein
MPKLCLASSSRGPEQIRFEFETSRCFIYTINGKEFDQGGWDALQKTEGQLSEMGKSLCGALEMFGLLFSKA